MTGPVGLEQARFLREWSAFIDGWARKTLGRVDSDELNDLRQEARIAAWHGYQEWSALPDERRDPNGLRAIVARKIKDAILDEWHRLRQRPRDNHQRGGGSAAELFRDYLDALVHTSRRERVRDRPDLIARCLTAYHLSMAGRVHGAMGLVTPENALLRQELLDRVVYALARIGDQERQIIEGVYFQHRELVDVAAELGVHGRSARSRRHRRALDEMRKYMDEFASARGVLDDEPGGGDSLP